MRNAEVMHDAEVLVVDDQRVNLLLLQRMLTAAGYRARCFPSGREALQSASACPPDLVLLDIDMPEMDGFAVCDRMRSNPGLSGVPILFLSAATAVEDKVRGFQCGAADFIGKPFQFEELCARVETHLELYRARESQQRHARQLEDLVRARTRELEESRLEILHRLAIAAEYRDRDTAGHTERVGWLSYRLAIGVGVPAAEAELIRMGALLHDVGKIGVPDEVLLYPGKLSTAQFAVMKRHVLIGADILSASHSPLLTMAETIARCHHERWDGNGYLEGLRGRAIPLAARIVSVADTFDALTHHRPYKEAWPRELAVEEIVKGAGTRFDPSVVRAFTEILPGIPAPPDGEASRPQASPVRETVMAGLE